VFHQCHSLSTARSENQAPDEETKTTFPILVRLRTTLGLRESHACGGDIRLAVDATAISSETGKPTCESRKPLALAMG